MENTENTGSEEARAKAIVRAVKAHAHRHYEDGDGWDYVVECWQDEDIWHFAAEAKDEADAINTIGRIVGATAEAEAETRW